MKPHASPCRCFRIVVFISILMHVLPLRAHNMDYIDHGVPVPAGNARTIVAMEDADGRPIIFAWLLRGAIIIDAQTGKAEQYPAPPGLSKTVSPFSFLMTEDGKFYTVVGIGGNASVMLEFDVMKREWREVARGPYRAAMSMTHDTKNDIIYAGIYPHNHLVAYDRKNNKFTDFGILVEESWEQYPRAMEMDSAGWLYVAIGVKSGNLIAFNPETREVKQIASNEERLGPWASLHLAADGKVYGELYKGGPLYVMYNGEATRIDALKPAVPPHRKGHQYSILSDFPDGSELVDIDFVDKKAVIRDAATGKTREIHFDYKARDGDAFIYTLALGPGGKVIGGTGRLLRLFQFDPTTGDATNIGIQDDRAGHINSLSAQGTRIFGGSYSKGALFMYDTSHPINGDARSGELNPRVLDAQWDDIRRPSAVLADRDGHFVLMGGLPSAKKPAGGLLVYDLEADKGQLLTHEQVIPYHSTFTLVQLPDGSVLGGTRAEEGSDGSARLYQFDAKNRKVLKVWVPVENARDIRDMVVDEDGLVYGVARIVPEGDHPHNGIPVLFAFDPISREVLHREDLSPYSTRLVGMNDGRMLVLDGNSLYTIFTDAIVYLDTQNMEHKALPTPPVAPSASGVALNGRVYFASGTHLWSFKALDPAGQ